MKKIVVIIIIIILISIYYYYYFGYHNYYYENIKYNNKYTIEIKNKENLLTYNSSISKENGNYIIYSRVDNMKTLPIIYDVNKYRKIYLGITVLDKNFNILYSKIENENIQNKDMYEDLRVFFFKNKKYFLGCCCKRNTLNFYPIFYPIILDEKYNIINIVDEKNNLYYSNKNFIPIIMNYELYIIKYHNPLEILKVIKIDDNKCYTINYFKGKLNNNLPKLRGSTTYLQFSENYLLGITHTMNIKLLFSSVYRHYITLINISDINNPYIEKISEPLCLLENCGIEFVMGFIESYHENKYIITLGKNDKTSHIIEIEKEYIYQLLN